MGKFYEIEYCAEGLAWFPVIGTWREFDDANTAMNSMTQRTKFQYRIVRVTTTTTREVVAQMAAEAALGCGEEGGGQ